MYGIPIYCDSFVTIQNLSKQIASSPRTSYNWKSHFHDSTFDELKIYYREVLSLIFLIIGTIMTLSKDENTSNANAHASAQSKKVWASLLSGAGAGLACTIICAPLDVAKVRLQIQGSLGIHKYGGGTVSVLRTIYGEEGIRGVFRGVGPAMLTVPLFWGVYWPFYDNTKAWVRKSFPEWSQPSVHFVSAVSAGIVGDIITNPFWVTRTRIQTLIMHPESSGLSMSTFRMMRTIYEQEGFIALYKGLAASMLGLSHVAIQFPLYEYLKQVARDRNQQQESITDIMGASVVAKLIASSITYPHEVLRARMQDARNDRAHHKSNLRLRDAFHEIVAKEGFLSLWSGLRVNLVRIIPATLTTFVSYEYLSRYFKQLYEA